MSNLPSDYPQAKSVDHGPALPQGDDTEQHLAGYHTKDARPECRECLRAKVAELEAEVGRWTALYEKALEAHLEMCELATKRMLLADRLAGALRGCVDVSSQLLEAEERTSTDWVNLRHVRHYGLAVLADFDAMKAKPEGEVQP